MHGDDVASAGVTLTTEMVLKATEIIFEMLKVGIDKERQYVNNKTAKLEDAELSGGEVSFKRLKKSGEISMIPGYDKANFKELVKRAKALDVPVAGVKERGKENTLSVFFSKKDEAVISRLEKEIKSEKMKDPKQSVKMTTISKSETEGFSMYCADHDIPVSFMETRNGDVKCIFDAAYEKQVSRALDNYHIMQGELSKISVEVVKDKGKPKIVVTDMNDGKKLTMNFSTKARLERMLNERLGFEPFKAAEVANVLADRLTDEQKRYFYSGSRTVEQMEYFEKDIRFEDDNILTENFSFAKMKLRNEKVPHLTITDGAENFVVLSGLGIDRAKVEQDIRKFLHIKDDETIAAIMKKAERLGFADKTLKKSFKQFTIERETLNSFNVTGGTTVLKLNLDDKEAAVKQLEDTFGISRKKAERIVDKAAKQSVSANTLKRIKSILPKKENAIEHKTRERGSRK